MKKLFFVMILAALLILSGCNTKKDPYQFPNSLENVVSIELLHNRNENGIGTDEVNIYPIYSLKEDEFSSFMWELYALGTDWDAPPSWGYGDYIAKISYSNGDVEMFGSLHIEYIAGDCGENYLRGYGCYRFESKEAFIRLLEKYCELPEEV